MSLLNIQNLSVTLGDPLFSDLTVTLTKGDRLGLVAANGRGKTTLLGCIAGTFEPTSGDITRARGLRVGHVAQYVPDADLDMTLYNKVLSALPADQADFEGWRVDVALDELSVPCELQQTLLRELSGGWQRTALLAAAWITQPDILLLDEPTNHLDLGRIALLETWLTNLPREVGVVITSHDRAFLDATTNRTLFLRETSSRDFATPFSHARLALDEADAADERRFANDLNKASQLRKQAAKLKNIGINSGSDLLITKTTQLTERAAKIEAAAKPAHREKGAGEIKLGNAGTHAKALVTFDDVQVSTPDGRPLYTSGQKWITPGDRIVLLGANGTGKTQLMNMVYRALIGKDSTVKSAPSVTLGYSDQHLSQLTPTDTPMQAIGDFGLGDQRARGLLAAAGVMIQMQDTPLAKLSGGQKARLAMLVLRLQHPNFYPLDEPTNHLDIEGQEALEEELCAHDAACLLVSHDRSFVRNVGNRFWWIDRRRLVEVESPEAFFEAQMS
jgi:ATPase subunit of ABC transporter with duplicated ATPase domains